MKPPHRVAGRQPWLLRVCESGREGWEGLQGSGSRAELVGRGRASFSHQGTRPTVTEEQGSEGQQLLCQVLSSNGRSGCLCLEQCVDMETR